MSRTHEIETPLRRIREKRGLKLIYVADKIKIDRGYYSRIESGAKIPSGAVAIRIQEWFLKKLGETISLNEILDPRGQEPAQTTAKEA